MADKYQPFPLDGVPTLDLINALINRGYDVMVRQFIDDGDVLDLGAEPFPDCVYDNTHDHRWN